jgi:phosphoglycerate dehydrogenase-like enzyme
MVAAPTTFSVNYTGDYLNEEGRVGLGDIALDLYAEHRAIAQDFLRDQSPLAGDATYWDRLYSLRIEPHHVASSNGIVIFRPWVPSSAFADGADKLVVIGRAGAGTDKIDLAACTANDVAVFNAPDTLTHATASSAFVLMLALAKRLTEQERLLRTNRWDLQPQTMGIDLPGKTLGIIGLGASGRELARLCAPWGMTLIAWSPRANPADAAALGVTLVPTLDDLLRASDFVSLHNRLDATTRGTFGARQFGLMKPTAYFINVARGEIVRQHEMVEALRAHRIAGAGLDVYEHEPIGLDDPLLSLDNVILTPHWLPSTRDAARMTMETMSRGMIRASQGLVPENIVNREVIDRPGWRQKLARHAVRAGT